MFIDDYFPFYSLDGNVIRVVAFCFVSDSLNLFTQIIKVRSLLTVDERHLVVTLLYCHRGDALQDEVDPRICGGHEGGAGDAGYVFFA